MLVLEHLAPLERSEPATLATASDLFADAAAAWRTAGVPFWALLGGTS